MRQDRRRDFGQTARGAVVLPIRAVGGTSRRHGTISVPVTTHSRPQNIKLMKPEKIYSICFSPTGTSRKIAEAVARGLAEAFDPMQKTATSGRERNYATEPTISKKLRGQHLATSAPQTPQTGAQANGETEATASTTDEADSKEDAGSVTTVDLTHPSPAAVAVSRDTVAVIAVPVYGGKVATTARKRLEAVHGNGTPVVLIVLYGNRAFEGALVELSEIAATQGFIPIAAAAFVGEHSYSTDRYPIAVGRPDASDLAEAVAFGRRTGERLGSGATLPAAGTDRPSKSAGKMATGTDHAARTEGEITAIDVREIAHPASGFWPMLRFIRFVLGYRRRQKRRPVVYLPAADPARCIHCGRCATLCPVAAIAAGDEEHTDPTRCIRCCACVKGCPVHARTFETPFAAALSRNFRRQKPNVFFPR